MTTTEVILYERVAKVGDIGDIVKVRSGYARNYLFPLGKALRNNKKNREYFEEKKDLILAENLEKKQDAGLIHKLINGKELIVVVNTSDSGQLYGSVNSNVIVSKLATLGAKVSRSSVLVLRPFKSVGIYEVELRLHADVTSKVVVNISRSEQEAIDQRNAGVVGVAEEFFAKAKALKERKALKESEEKRKLKEDKKDKKDNKSILSSNTQSDAGSDKKGDKQEAKIVEEVVDSKSTESASKNSKNSKNSKK